MQISRGMRDKISNHLNPGNNFSATMSINGNAVYDYCCFGVDSNGKLSDDRYMIFYNQTASPQGEIRYREQNPGVVFDINLSSLPQTIDKLVFTASIDGNGTMGEISNFSFIIDQDNAEKISLHMTGADFKAEKAIIAVEIYRKEDWRISAVANGFNGGLSALLAYYGGTEESTPAPAPAPAAAPVTPAPAAAPVVQPVTPAASVTPAPAAATPAPQPVPGRVSLHKNEEQVTQEIMGKISLSKDKVKLEKHVVSLSKCVVDLSEKSGVDLGSTKAKVVVALDYSGSMDKLYKNGTIQNTIDKLVPLGLTFDDNGSIDVYLFQDTYRKLDDLNLSNYEQYVAGVIKKANYPMGGTNYAPVLQAIIKDSGPKKGGFLGLGIGASKNKANSQPTFILFITDGENFDKSETDNVIRKSSEMDVFIQFIGIGNAGFQYLMKLDDLPGRKRDNTGFSKMKDLDKATDSELYSNVLEQFSGWLKGLQ